MGAPRMKITLMNGLRATNLLKTGLRATNLLMNGPRAMALPVR